MNPYSIQEGESSLGVCCAPDGCGDYLASIEVAVDGFSGHADGHVVGSEWLAFMDALARLEQTRKGEARFCSAFPGEFEVKIHSIDSRGHMGVSGLLRYSRAGGDEWPHQALKFAFAFDPSKLPSFARAVAHQK